MPKRTDIRKILIIGSGPIVVLLGSLLLAVAALARPSVEVLAPQPSSQHPRITVLRDGSSVRSAEVAVSTAAGKTLMILSTDKHGIVVLPSLHVGQYTVAARAPGRLQAYLLLDISNKKLKKPSEFSLQLQLGPPSFEELIDAAESAAPPERLPVFSGTVVDAGGAEISKVEIRIYQRGSAGKTLVSTAMTDSTGHFGAHLPSGAYTAVLVAPGFRIKIHVFEIAADTLAQETLIRLGLAAVTE
jgi:hypothetical protein